MKRIIGFLASYHNQNTYNKSCAIHKKHPLHEPVCVSFFSAESEMHECKNFCIFELFSTFEEVELDNECNTH